MARREQVVTEVVEETVRSIAHAQSEYEKLRRRYGATYTRWMANRVDEVFGDEMKRYSNEAMILYYGLLQTIMIKQKVDQKPLDSAKTITITMR